MAPSSTTSSCSSKSRSSSSRRSRWYNGGPGPLSVEVADAPAVEGEGKPRRHPLMAGATPGTFLSNYDESVHTLYESFQRSVRLFSILCDIHLYSNI